MWLGVRSIDGGSAVPPPVWQPPQTLNALDLSCVRVGAAGGVDEALICPRIAPLASAGGFTFTYSLFAGKVPTAPPGMGASPPGPRAPVAPSLGRGASVRPLAPPAPPSPPPPPASPPPAGS